MCIPCSRQDEFDVQYRISITLLFKGIFARPGRLGTQVLGLVLCLAILYARITHEVGTYVQQ